MSSRAWKCGVTLDLQVVPDLEIDPEQIRRSEVASEAQAVSAVIRRFPWTISLMKRRGTPDSYCHLVLRDPESQHQRRSTRTDSPLVVDF